MPGSPALPSPSSPRRSASSSASRSPSRSTCGGSPASACTASAGGWISPLYAESARVMHLLRRTTFGYTPAQLEAALSDGFNMTVDRLLETNPAEPPPFSAAVTPGGRFAIAQLQQWWIDHM